jgi:hypothetical protein
MSPETGPHRRISNFESKRESTCRPTVHRCDGRVNACTARAPVAGCDPTTSSQSTLIETVCQPDAPSGAGGALASVWTCPSESVARTARLW